MSVSFLFIGHFNALSMEENAFDVQASGIIFNLCQPKINQQWSGERCGSIYRYQNNMKMK